MLGKSKTLPEPSKFALSPGCNWFQVVSATRSESSVLKVKERIVEMARLRLSLGSRLPRAQSSAIPKLPPLRPKRCSPK